MTSCCPSVTSILRTFNACFLLTSFLTLTFIDKVTSRARMIEPPMRSSYWRKGVSREGIDAPVNFNDELLNCGGFEYQWNQMNGACGACGDKIGSRENEYPGKYSQFPPQRTYRTSRGTRDINQANSLNTINVTVSITVNQLGYFTFRLCPYRDGPSSPYMDLADCFNRQKLLVVQDVNSTRYYPGSKGGFHDLHLEIPVDVSCEHCILQWTYLTGYREGRSGQCEPCLGCGPQEQYVNCADIQILPFGVTPPTEEPPRATISTPQTSTSISSTSKRIPPPTPTTPRGSTTRTPNGGMITPNPNNNLTPCTPSANIVTCEARDIHRLIPEMNSWCLGNCKSGHCRENFCDCFCNYPGYKIRINATAFDLKTTHKNIRPSPSTNYHCYKPLPEWSHTPGMSGWCANNCPSVWCADMCSLQICP